MDGKEQSTGSPVDVALHGLTIEGDAISFYIWRGTGQPVKLIVKGTRVGDSIHFAVVSGPTHFIFDPGTEVKEVRFEAEAVRE